MATDLHTLTAPVFVRALTNLDKILDKGRAFAAEKGIDENELLDARLIDGHGQPHLADPARQRFCQGRAWSASAGVENVVMEDNEASFDDLKARIAKTIDFVKSVPADAINGKEERRGRAQIPQRRIQVRRAAITCSASSTRISISTSRPPTTFCA